MNEWTKIEWGRDKAPVPGTAPEVGRVAECIRGGSKVFGCFQGEVRADSEGRVSVKADELDVTVKTSRNLPFKPTEESDQFWWRYVDES